MIKSWRLICAGHAANVGEKMNAYKFLVGKPEGKRPLGRPKRRWEDNIKVQDKDQLRPLANTVMKLRVP
jgi:hypothetical protein